jgi:hypothetical protein
MEMMAYMLVQDQNFVDYITVNKERFCGYYILFYHCGAIIGALLSSRASDMLGRCEQNYNSVFANDIYFLKAKRLLYMHVHSSLEQYRGQHPATQNWRCFPQGDSHVRFN